MGYNLFTVKSSLYGFLWLAMLFACIGTTVGFFGRHWWVFELASHFPLQYSAILLTSGLICLYLGNYKTTIIAGAFALANLYLIVPSDTEVHAKAPSTYRESRKFRALLINVNHGNHDYEKVRRFISLTDADFIVLLEVNEQWLEELQPIEVAYPYSKRYFHIHVHAEGQILFRSTGNFPNSFPGSKDRRRLPLKDYGIVLFSRIPLEDADIKLIGKVGNPSVTARFNIDGQRFTLIVTHPDSPVSKARAKNRNQQIAALGQLISSRQGTTIVLGDLNMTPWSPFFRDFLTKTGMRDSRDGFGLQPTWPVRFPLFWIPIDHCLVSPNVIVHNRTIGPDIGSDHYPVVVDFSVTPHQEVANQRFG